MEIDHAISFTLFQHPARVIIEADLEVAEGEAFYLITSATLIELGQSELNCDVDLDDLPREACKQIEKAFDDYIRENSDELIAAASEYEADLAFDAWKEAHDYE